MTAEDFREFVDARIKEHLPSVERMVEYGIGIVTSANSGDRTCTVELRGSVSAGWAMGEFDPEVGDRVRVAWVGSDKWVDAILGRAISSGGGSSDDTFAFFMGG